MTRNQGEKKINSLLDHVSTSSNMRLLQVGSATVLVSCSCCAVKAQLERIQVLRRRCVKLVRDADGKDLLLCAGVLCHHAGCAEGRQQ